MTEITARLSTALGEGGMATVYLAEGLEHKRNVGN